MAESVIEIGETQTDSIAEVGFFLERRSGGFVVADKFLPRIRSYHDDGRPDAAFGRFGDGPFEFRQVSGVAETPSGQLVVSDSRRTALVYLTSGLKPDTIVSVPGTPRRIVSFGRDLVVRMDQLAAARGPSRLMAKPPLIHRLTGGQVTWSAYRARFSVVERPYWGSLWTELVAAAGDSVFVMTSVTYPITILDESGDSVGTIGNPSESFRPVPVFDRGQFVNMATYATTLSEMLASFDVAGRLDIVSDTYLVVTHSRLDDTFPPPSFRRIHSTLDIYDRHTGAKLYEDVPLPERSRVLGGGRYLYILLDQDFPPWRVAKLRLLAR